MPVLFLPTYRSDSPTDATAASNLNVDFISAVCSLPLTRLVSVTKLDELGVDDVVMVVTGGGKA